MTDLSSLQFKVKFVDPSLDSEEQDEQAMRLMRELKEMEEVEKVGPALDPNPPEGNKSLGGFLSGVLQGEAETGAFKSVFQFIGDRSAAKNIEMEIARNGRTLKIAASSKDEIQTVLPLLQQFLSETESAVEPIKRTILVLPAMATDAARTRLDEEVRDIQEGLVRSRYRDQLSLETRWTADSRDIQRAVLETKPNIVHFSGDSGVANGETLIVAEQSDASADEAMAEFFKLFADRVNCVLLNNGQSVSQAGAIAKHIDYVIGMSGDLPEPAAIEFSIGFYDALGAGESVEFAFNLGRNAIRLAGLAGHDIPVLKCKGSLS